MHNVHQCCSCVNMHVFLFFSIFNLPSNKYLDSPIILLDEAGCTTCTCLLLFKPLWPIDAHSTHLLIDLHSLYAVIRTGHTTQRSTLHCDHCGIVVQMWATLKRLTAECAGAHLLEHAPHVPSRSPYCRDLDLIPTHCPLHPVIHHLSLQFAAKRKQPNI